MHSTELTELFLRKDQSVRTSVSMSSKSYNLGKKFRTSLTSTDDNRDTDDTEIPSDEEDLASQANTAVLIDSPSGSQIESPPLPTLGAKIASKPSSNTSPGKELFFFYLCKSSIHFNPYSKLVWLLASNMCYRAGRYSTKFACFLYKRTNHIQSLPPVHGLI